MRTTTAPPRAPAASRASPTKPSAAPPSWRQRQLLPKFGGRNVLAIARSAALKPLGVGELADHHRIETGVAHQPGRDLHRLGIIAGDRHRKLRIGPVRLAFEYLVVERVEGAHQPYAGQIFL